MKKRFLTLAALALLFAGLNSCSKNDPTSTNELGLSADIKAKITALGFGAEDAFAVEGGYIVENDIFIPTEDLDKPMDLAHSLVIGHEEHYHTTNLVTGLPRTITISRDNKFSVRAKAGITAAVKRYNDEKLQLTFQEVGNSGGDIHIRRINGGGYIASAGFPSGGNPYPEIKYNRTYENYSLGFVTTVMAHEIGHCIGFRHTDYMNRAYSCGSGGDEGSGSVGAVHIPGTPTGPDEHSWMLACLSATTDRPFQANDKTALGFLY